MVFGPYDPISPIGNPVKTQEKLWVVKFDMSTLCATYLTYSSCRILLDNTSWPKGSMYDICTHIWPIFLGLINVGKYAIDGSYGWVIQPYLSNILWLSICFLLQTSLNCLKRWQWRNKRGHHGGAGSPYCPQACDFHGFWTSWGRHVFFVCGPGRVQYTSLQFNSLDWFLDIFGIFSWTVR